MKTFTRFFLKNKALSWLLLILIILGGIFSYYTMGKLEDAPFTIKQALITTTYPGASPAEVQQQVKDQVSRRNHTDLYFFRRGISHVSGQDFDLQRLWPGICVHRW